MRAPLTLPFSELDRNSVAIAGGKGASLGEMTRAGIPVPPGFVALTDAFESFLDESGLQAAIKGRLAAVRQQEQGTVQAASEAIRRLILEAAIPADIQDAVTAAFDALGAGLVAVRSSATAEDGAEASWAGELESYLNVGRDDLLEKVRLCWSSLFTPRAIFYRIENGFGAGTVSVAVVVQKMVEAEVSGIAFSVHPVTEDPSQLIIEAGYGLGEAIVSGAVTPDSYVVDKRDLSLVECAVSRQDSRFVRAEAGNRWEAVPSELQGAQKLDAAAITELARMVVSIESHYGFPCDIEWAWGAGSLYILQSRPITTLAH